MINTVRSGSPAPVSCGSPGVFVVNKSDLDKRKSTNLSQLSSDREFFRLSQRAREADKKVVIVVLLYYPPGTQTSLLFQYSSHSFLDNSHHKIHDSNKMTFTR